MKFNLGDTNRCHLGRQEGQLTSEVRVGWPGYLSAAMCKRFAYGPADATANHHLLLQ